jgi:hypothetical protein
MTVVGPFCWMVDDPPASKQVRDRCPRDHDVVAVGGLAVAKATRARVGKQMTISVLLLRRWFLAWPVIVWS